MSWYDEAEYIRKQAKNNNEFFANSLPMIASENVLSPLCREMLISDFHGRYAEGTPGHRYYAGCNFFDLVEEKAMELAKKLFNCHYADVRPTAGTTANLGILKALIKPGETATVLDLANGAHISFGKWGGAGVRGVNLVSYPFNDEEMNIDVDGAHIRTLLLTFLYRQMLPLVQGGFVYIGQPPLYRLAKGKNEKYFLDEDELNNHLFTQASEKIKVIVEDSDETEITGDRLVKVLRDLSLYQKLVSYLNRMNIWEDLLFNLLTKDIRKADQFADKEVVESIIEDLSGNKEMKVGSIRPCR